MKILIACIFFKELTGSELYVYELAKQLVKKGHDVTVASSYVEGGNLPEIARKNGIRVISKISSHEKFDLIHCQHYPITVKLLKHFPSTPFVTTIHSEVYGEENPVISENIKKYIVIRPEIKEHIISQFNIPESFIKLIYNPVDVDRFNTKDTTTSNSVLFVGTIDSIRKNAIFDMVEYTLMNGKEFWLIGKDCVSSTGDNYLTKILKYPHVRYSPERNDVEKYTKMCGQTAGILLGRTTIEGWLCGKEGWIYQIDTKGNILSKALHPIPEDVQKFNSSHVADQIEAVYKEVLSQP